MRQKIAESMHYKREDRAQLLCMSNINQQISKTVKSLAIIIE